MVSEVQIVMQSLEPCTPVLIQCAVMCILLELLDIDMSLLQPCKAFSAPARYALLFVVTF